MATKPVNGASTLMHQTDASGQALNAAVPINIVQKKSSASDVFYRIFCCFPTTDSNSALVANRARTPLLPAARADESQKKCLVLDLDETLVHSSFKEIPNPDFVIPVEIDGTVHRVYVSWKSFTGIICTNFSRYERGTLYRYVLKRPGVDAFLEKTGKLFEIVVFTASLSKYADPLLDLLDIHKVVRHRLFRESCTWHEGNYVKDLQILGRPIEKTIIVDNSPMSYLFQPENAIGVSSFIDDPTDRELYYCLPFLESILPVDNVVQHLHKYPNFVQEQARLQGM